MGPCKLLSIRPPLDSSGVAERKRNEACACVRLHPKQQCVLALLARVRDLPADIRGACDRFAADVENDIADEAVEEVAERVANPVCFFVRPTKRRGLSDLLDDNARLSGLILTRRERALRHGRGRAMRRARKRISGPRAERLRLPAAILLLRLWLF